MSGAPITKELFSLLALVLTFITFAPYYRSIWRRQIKPHVISWFIWAGGTFTVFVAQLLDGGGVGAWPLGISACLTLGVALLAMQRAGDTSIDRTDWLFLVMALSALPLWFFTQNAFSAVLIMTLVDLLGFGPSLRKAYRAPHEESALFFTLGAVRNGFLLLALEHYSATTILFPAAIGIACLMFVMLIMVQRRRLALA